MAGIDALLGNIGAFDREYSGYGGQVPNDPGVYDELSRAMPMNYGTPGLARGNAPTSADIARAYQMRAAQRQPTQASQRGGQMQQGTQYRPPQNPPLSAQYADLTKDPGGMRQQMSGVGNTIGNALRANSDAMTAAGVGPLAPYSEKNPGPYNYMGPAMYGGESADKLAQEKSSMFPSMGAIFGGGMGGGGMGGGYGGGMGYVPKPEDLQRQIDYMDTMDMVRRRHQQNGAEAFQQNMMRFPQYAGAFNTVLGGIFGGANRQQFPTSFNSNFGGSGGVTQQPPKPVDAIPSPTNPNGYKNNMVNRYY